MGFFDVLKDLNPLSIVGDVLGAGINSWSQNKLLEKQTTSQTQLQEAQNAYNTEMWNANNAYNAPTAQVQRLQDAGINPALMFGSNMVNSSGSPASAQSISAPNVPQPAFDLGHIGTQAIQNELAFSQIQKNLADARLSDRQADTEKALLHGRIRLLQADAALSETRKEEVKAQVAYLTASKAYTDALTNKTDSEREQIEQDVRFMAQLYPEQIAETKARVHQLLSQTKVNKAQERYLNNSLSLLSAMSDYYHSSARVQDKSVEVMDSQIHVNKASAKELGTRSQLQESQDIIAKEEGKQAGITTEIMDDTKGTEKFSRNYQNTVGNVMMSIQQGCQAFGELKGLKISQKNADINQQNANRKGKYNEHYGHDVGNRVPRAQGKRNAGRFITNKTYSR